ncbi:MAG: acyl-CoA dehydrogenase family protein [Christensenellales bacterium]
MNFELSEQHKLMQQFVRDFAQKELAPGVIERDETSTFPVDIYKKIGKMGITGLPYPSAYGGQDGDFLSYILAVEELCKVDASFGSSLSIGISLYAGGVMNGGSEEQKKKYLPKVLSGDAFGSFGLTEPGAGSDVGAAVTIAKKNGDHYVINGSKCFITNGPLSEYFLIFAMTAPELKTKGISAFIIEKGFPGFSVGTIENKCGLRAMQVSELIFDDCIVPAENLVLEEGKGFGLAMKTLDAGRIGVGAQGLGIAEGAFDIAKKYLATRIQFDKPLYQNQYLAFKMAELEVEIEQAKYMLYKAALDKQEGRPFTVSAAKAKLVCTNAAMHVASEAVQMLGGNGYMKEYHVERMMRDAKITQIYEGTNEIQKMIISSALFR